MPRPTFLQLDSPKRRRVERAAMAEFAAQPYQQANLDRIAAAAGVPKGSLYQYFDNKRDLFDWVVGVAFQKAWELFGLHLALSKPRDCFDEFRQALLFALSLPRKEPLIARLYFRIGFLETSELQGEIAARNRLFQDHWFERGIASGLLDRNIDRAIAGFLLDAISNRFHFFALSRAAPPRKLRALADQLTDAVCRSLQKEDSHVSSGHVMSSGDARSSRRRRGMRRRRR